MKIMTLALILGLGFTVHAEDAVVNCDQAAAGKVTISSKTERLSLTRAAELAYGCLIKRGGNESVRKAKADAIRSARKTGDEEYMARRNCGKTIEPLQSLILTSWSSGRPDVGGDGLAEMGGEGLVLVRQPISCIGIGTGLYEGSVSSASIKLSTLETYKFSMDDDSVSQQTIIIELKEILKNL